MPKILVNTPFAGQQIEEISDTGSYFDYKRVLWDERVDGPIPADIELGKMRKAGKQQLVKDPDYSADHKAFLAEQDAKQKELNRKKELADAVNADADIAALKALSIADIDSWVDANLGNIAQIKQFNKKLIKALISKGIL